MEQYIDTCPKHKTKFGPDRYCKKCDFKWPKQNYICTTGTPSGYFWLDGFKSAEGIVRQYILTAEKMRGVASNIVGKDRVYAIGLSFFTSKEKKPEPQRAIIRNNNYYGWVESPNYLPVDWQYNYYTTSDSFDETQIGCPIKGSTTDGYDSKIVKCCFSSSVSSPSSSSTSNSAKCGKTRTKNTAKNIEAKASQKTDRPKFLETRGLLRGSSIVQEDKLEVGAGAKINQAVYDDPETLEYWHDEPEAIICINYCSAKDAEKIFEGGYEPIESCEDGYLKDIPVGN